MQWLVSNQQARRNMIYGELIFANPLATNKIVSEKEEKRVKEINQELIFLMLKRLASKWAQSEKVLSVSV